MSKKMDQACPKISVIIPHYNMAKYLPAATKSVERQDYDNIELIIIDDGSQEQPDWNQLTASVTCITRIIKIEHAGKPTAVNQGFKTASGDFLVILDADDRLPEKSLSARARALQSGADLCIGSFSIICSGKVRVHRQLNSLRDKNRRIIVNKYLNGVIAPFHQNAMMFSRKLLDRVGDMDPKMIRGQDKDFAIRLLLGSQKTALIERSVYQYNRYQRPLKKRLYNRCMGTRSTLITINRYMGLRRFWCWCCLVVVDTMKLIYNLFGVYKGLGKSNSAGIKT